MIKSTIYARNRPTIEVVKIPESQGELIEWLKYNNHEVDIRGYGNYLKVMGKWFLLRPGKYVILSGGFAYIRSLEYIEANYQKVEE